MATPGQGSTGDRGSGGLPAAQRVGLRFHLTGLTAAETADYIRHHLRVAGRDQPLFTDAALELLFRPNIGVKPVLHPPAAE